MPYLRIADVRAIGRKAIADGEVGKCPKCGSPNLDGLIPPDFESRRCVDCGKVSDQWRIKEGITAIGLDGQSDGGAGGPQGGGLISGEVAPVPPGPPNLKRTKMGRLVPEADVVPFSGSGPITFVSPNSSLPWQRRKRLKIKERSMRAIPASYHTYRNRTIGLPESVQIEWADDLLDDAHDLGYKFHNTNHGPGGQTTHILKHPSNGNTLHINDGPHPSDKHWMVRSKSGETLHQGAADHDHDWSLERTGKMKPTTDWTKRTDPILHSKPAYARERGLTFAHEAVTEEEGFLTGHPVDATQIGKIMIRVLDSVNLQIYAPSRILEQVEAYKFFEQFQMLIPKTPMLSIRVMESIASWWRNFAEIGDLLEIDCTTGFASVTNQKARRFYTLGSLGSVPDGTIPA